VLEGRVTQMRQRHPLSDRSMQEKTPGDVDADMVRLRRILQMKENQISQLQPASADHPALLVQLPGAARQFHVEGLIEERVDQTGAVGPLGRSSAPTIGSAPEGKNLFPETRQLTFVQLDRWQLTTASGLRLPFLLRRRPHIAHVRTQRAGEQQQQPFDAGQLYPSPAQGRSAPTWHMICFFMTGVDLETALKVAGFGLRYRRDNWLIIN
jgi:hypothetical protein